MGGSAGRFRNWKVLNHTNMTTKQIKEQFLKCAPWCVSFEVGHVSEKQAQKQSPQIALDTCFLKWGMFEEAEGPAILGIELARHCHIGDGEPVQANDASRKPNCQ